MPNENITRGEFGEWRREEGDFRRRLEDRMARQHADLTSQLTQVISLQREANGRVGKAEACIAIIQRELEAIKDEDRSIEAVVTRIETEGCRNFEKHLDTATVLEGAGVLPNTDGPCRAMSFPQLSNRQKVAAGVGATALLIPAISDLFKALNSLFQWLMTANIK